MATTRAVQGRCDKPSSKLALGVTGTCTAFGNILKVAISATAAAQLSHTAGTALFPVE
jgi:hypothetical protein